MKAPHDKYEVTWWEWFSHDASYFMWLRMGIMCHFVNS